MLGVSSSQLYLMLAVDESTQKAQLSRIGSRRVVARREMMLLLPTDNQFVDDDDNVDCRRKRGVVMIWRIWRRWWNEIDPHQ